MFQRVSCVVVFLSSSLLAQIVGLEPTKKGAAKFRKWLVDVRGGQRLICGEPIEGMKVEGTSIQKFAKPNYVTLLVADPARPERAVVKIGRNGKRTAVSGKYLLKLKPEHIKQPYHLVFRYQTLTGLREEYLRKRDRTDRLTKTLRGKKLGTDEWFRAYRELLSGKEALRTWLASTVYPEAAKRVDKELRALRSKAKGAASQSRLDAAKATVADYPIPKEFDQTSTKAGYELDWTGSQSTHVRVVGSADHVSPDAQRKGVLLGETIIEGVRAALVDPYLDEHDTDPIPDKLIHAFYFLPDSVPLKTAIYEGFFGRSFAEPRARSIKLAGHRQRAGAGAQYFEVWRRNAQLQVEGVVAHGLGHSLAAMIYNDNRQSRMPAWIEEGFANWISFEYLSRNNVTCIAFAVKRYAGEQEKEGVKQVGMGMRDAFNSLALEKGNSLDAIFRMTLAEMTTPDMCKAWSFLDFLFAKHPKEAYGFLRSACYSVKRGRIDLGALRKRAEQWFPVERGEDVYRHLEKMWRDYAVGGQSGGRRRR